MDQVTPAADGKFFITRKHTSQITHRKLDPFERKNPQVFDLYKAKHSTWKAAHDQVVWQSQREVDRLEKELQKAKGRLKRAMGMTEPV